MLEPRVSWGLVGAASRDRNPDRMARVTARGAGVFVTWLVPHAEADIRPHCPDRMPLGWGGQTAKCHRNGIPFLAP
jgi:hypothetical protein